MEERREGGVQKWAKERKEQEGMKTHTSQILEFLVARKWRATLCIDGDPAAPSERGTAAPSFQPMSIATVAHLSYCWAVVLYSSPFAAKNRRNIAVFDTFFKFGARSRHRGQIWHDRVDHDVAYSIPVQVSPWSVYRVAPTGRKTANLTKFWAFGSTLPTLTVDQSGPNLDNQSIDIR